MANFTDGPPTDARFNSLLGLAFDVAGNLYVADGDSGAIRKVAATTHAVTTVTGNGSSGAANGTLAEARFNKPTGIAVDTDGTIYVTETGSHTIRKITATTVSTLAGSGTAGYANGTGTEAAFNEPTGIVIGTDDALYVTDRLNNRIRKVTKEGVVTDLAGQTTAGFADGTGAAASFDGPQALAVDGTGNLWIADRYVIRKVTLGGAVTTIAGDGASPGRIDGTGTDVRFNVPRSIAITPAGDFVIGDSFSNRIRKLTPAGVVTTLYKGAGAPEAGGPSIVGLVVRDALIYASPIDGFALRTYPLP